MLPWWVIKLSLLRDECGPQSVLCHISLLVIRTILERWGRVHFFKFMIGIRHFIKSSKRRGKKTLQTFKVFLKMYIFVLQNGLHTALICLWEGLRLHSWACSSVHWCAADHWTVCKEGWSVQDLPHITPAVIPISINFNSTNKKLNKSGIMGSVVSCERSVVKKAEPDILWKRCLH